LEKCVEATTGGWVCASKMVEVPAGSFWMGCNNCAGSTVKDTSCGDNEHPYHEVHLDAYEIDRTEVTAAQYLACKNAGGCSAAGSGSYATYEVPGKEDHPVNYVNWSQAEDYCQWVGKELCTEAQWEKGARGGCEKNGGPSNCKAQSRKYPWGNETPICDLAVKSGCDGDTQPVCSRSPAGDSPYGLCDMAGNVWEWTADWYQKDYYCDGDGATGDAYCTECSSWPGSPNAWIKPFCTISGSYRVTRGGGFVSNVGNLRVSSRNVGSPSGDGNLGARCCRSE
jgi:formylglycine-generating enzyme required for sulfatase activity